MNAITPWAWAGIHGNNVAQIWPIAWELLSRCVDLDGGRYDEASLLQACVSGDMQLWLFGPVVSGNTDPMLAMTTELRIYPCAKWCNIKYVGGEGLSSAADFLGTIEAWAKSQGCAGIEGYGRLGWSKLLTRKGYQVRGQGYEKVLV